MMFDWADFLVSINVPTVLLAFIVGCSLGFVLLQLRHTFIPTHVYWMITAGVVFYLPLAMLRALQGSAIWERFIGTFILWCVFVLGIDLVNRFSR
jgi:hypothetical protein